MKTSTTTNSELFKNEVKATVSIELKESGLLSSCPSLVKLCWIQFNQRPFLESGEPEHFWCLHFGE